MARGWYVLHALSGYEAKVEAALRKMLEDDAELAESVFDVKIPQEEVMEVYKGKKRTINRKFLPGYMLIEMDLDDLTWKAVISKIRRINGVMGFLGTTVRGQKPNAITADEAKAVLQKTGDIKVDKQMRINVEYSTQHWIFPIITIGVLVILGVLLIALEGRARVKAGGRFFAKPGRFFAENYDKFKFWGCIVLMIVYFFFLDKLGFTFWSMICLYLFNTLFANKAQLKSAKYHVISVIISVVACLLISIVFGTLFAITLPSGLFTIEIPSLGFILY